MMNKGTAHAVISAMEPEEFAETCIFATGEKYINWNAGDSTVNLDGNFTAEELLAITLWVGGTKPDSSMNAIK